MYALYIKYLNKICNFLDRVLLYVISSIILNKYVHHFLQFILVLLPLNIMIVSSIARVDTTPGKSSVLTYVN